MKVKIKRIDISLPLPTYQTPGAVAFDLYSRIDLTIQPKTLERIPTNIIVAIPEGHMLQIKDRSSTLKRKGLWVSTGYIDQDFCGEQDEILLQVYNITNQEIIIEKGERLGQAAFIKIEKPEWEEVEQMNNNSRGGFGTTGK
jgi:dUTP pyrophosphatase